MSRVTGLKKWILSIHILMASIMIGLSAGILILAMTVYNTQDQEIMKMAYSSMAILAVNGHFVFRSCGQQNPAVVLEKRSFPLSFRDGREALCFPGNMVVRQTQRALPRVADSCHLGGLECEPGVGGGPA
jgi:hypothetical protein